MRRRLVLVTLLFLSFIARPPVHSSFAQSPENAPPPAAETPPPSSETSPPPVPTDEHRFPELLLHERADAVMELGELRSAVRMSPNSADGRLKLAQGLYRIGDLDAAIDECRMAIAMKPDDARAHLQLGVALMAKQDLRASLAELKETTRLNPELTQAHYNLGTVYYTTGNLKAAIQSYRKALELQASFPDARYRLALVLKLAHRDQESVQFMEEAALGGVPQAQYFLGNAYRNGQGVEKNLTLAIRWWTTAVAFGQQRAAESLSQLRRQALSPDQSERRRKDAIEALDSIAMNSGLITRMPSGTNRANHWASPCSKTAKPPTESRLCLPKPLRWARLRTTNWRACMKPASIPASLNSIRASWRVLLPPLRMVSSRQRKHWHASMAKASVSRRICRKPKRC